MARKTDVVILGAGSAGYAAALRAAQLGLEVVLVEAEQVGGTCLHRGCIPTKAWLHAAEVRRTVLAAPAMGISCEPGGVDVEQVGAWSRSVVDDLHRGLKGLLRARAVEVVHGSGKLVVDEEGPAVLLEDSLIRGRHVVLATGAEPVDLGLPVDGNRVLTSDHAFGLTALPERAVVIGGGVIGVEFASMWGDLGVEVTLVEATDSLLPLEEPDLVSALARSLAARGVDIKLNSLVDDLQVSESGVKVSIGGEEVAGDAVLVAAGRRARTDAFEDAGVRLEGGHVAVDEFLGTSVPGVHAVGDLVTGPQLAHRGYAHGMFIAERIAQLEGRHGSRPQLPKDQDIARVTYSSPQLASVGLTTAEAEATGGAETADFPLRGNGRALTLSAPGERETGFVRLIRRPGGEIVGVHAVGNGVAEIITEGSLLVGWQATPADLRDIVHPHPTLSEAIAEASFALARIPFHMHR